MSNGLAWSRVNNNWSTNLKPQNLGPGGSGGGQIGVGTHQDIIQSSKRLYKAKKDYTKPRQTPKKLYKALTDYTQI